MSGRLNFIKRQRLVRRARRLFPTRTEWHFVRVCCGSLWHWEMRISPGDAHGFVLQQRTPKRLKWRRQDHA